MNTKLQETLADILEKTSDGVDLLKGEIPEVVSELLLWYGVYNGIMFLSGVALALCWYEFFKRTSRGSLEVCWKLPTPLNLSVIVGGVVSIFAIPSLLNLTWLKIWIAPKIWLIEYTASLAQKVSG